MTMSTSWEGWEARCPDYINTLMLNKSFLFLGYRLLDWNVRYVTAHRRPRLKRGALQVPQGGKENWSKCDVNVHTTDLDDFAMQVAGKLGLDIPRRG